MKKKMMKINSWKKMMNRWKKNKKKQNLEQKQNLKKIAENNS